MLTVFLSVLPAAFTLWNPLSWGNAVFGAGVGGAKTEDGVRRPLLGVDGAVFGGAGPRPWVFPALFRVLFMGNAGNAMSGGGFEDLDGRGNVVAIVEPGGKQAGRFESRE